MVRKKMEGDENQRRAAANRADREGERPSARGETTGASKQPTHLTGQSSLTHEERLAETHRGKQDEPRSEDVEGPVRTPADLEPERTFAGRGKEYTDQHARVFEAVTEAQEERGGEAVVLDVVARGAGLPKEETRALLHDLATTHRLVTELQRPEPGSPDMGTRFEAKPRL